MNKVKIFYSCSVRKGQKKEPSAYETHLSVLSKLDKKKNISIIDSQDKKGSAKIDEKVFDQIRNCDLFVADITPDMEVNDSYIYNELVMMELAIALSIHNHDNILIFCEKKYDLKKIPIAFKTKNCFAYESGKDAEVALIILDKVDELEKNSDWKVIDYFCNENLQSLIETKSELTIKKLITKINKPQRRIMIVIQTATMDNYIDVNQKRLKNDKKDVDEDLSKSKNINDELKHLEMMINIAYFNK